MDVLAIVVRLMKSALEHPVIGPITAKIIRNATAQAVRHIQGHIKKGTKTHGASGTIHSSA